VADLFLITHHIPEHRHLFHFLETALSDGLVCSLRRHKKHRCVIPVGCLYCGHKTGHAWSILGDRHAHLACCAGIAIADQAPVGFMGYIPKRDSGFGEIVRDRHECRADDAKGMLNAVHLQDFYESLFRGHFGHDSSP
jgi:hypothetical protein